MKNTKKFIFVSIPKTGTQTIHTMLGANLYKQVNFVHGGILDNHVRAEIMKQKYEDFDEHFVFAFVRNPWTRLISWYSGHLKWNITLYKSMSFDEWIMKKCPHHWKLKENEFSPLSQYHFIYDRQGYCLADKVYKFENFQDDLSSALTEIGLDLPIIHINKSQKKQQYSYTDEMIDIVADVFQKDIEFFNYSFPKELLR